jgi:hypothetical protein
MKKKVFFIYGKSCENMVFEDLDKNNIGYYNISVDLENRRIIIGRDPRNKIIYHFCEQPLFRNWLEQFIESPYEMSVCSVWKNKPIELTPITCLIGIKELV